MSDAILTLTADRSQPGSLRAQSGSFGTIAFRAYQMFPGQRLLLKDGQTVEIGSRAFDLLCVLARARGTVVPKRTIFDHVWPDVTVDESNLRFQMASLRRALGPDRDLVKTIQGRGYMFVANPGEEPATAAGEGGRVGHVPEVERAPDEPAGTQVAVIEDDDGTREALDGLLRSSGLAPRCFPTPQAFLSSSAPARAKCLVLDVCLPGRNGLDFHAELRRSGVSLPVIFISGHADVPMSVRAMKAGAVEFLTKPVRHEELLQAVEGAVGRRRAV